MDHFKEYGKKNGIFVDTVNGEMEHFHLLIGLLPTHSASEVANRLKGESSNWVNKSEIIKGKFAWQTGYSVFSVSESQLGKLRRYILDQEDHHRRKNYQEELEQMLKLHGLDGV